MKFGKLFGNIYKILGKFDGYLKRKLLGRKSRWNFDKIFNEQKWERPDVLSSRRAFAWSTHLCVFLIFLTR